MDELQRNVAVVISDEGNAKENRAQSVISLKIQGADKVAR